MAVQQIKIEGLLDEGGNFLPEKNTTQIEQDVSDVKPLKSPFENIFNNILTKHYNNSGILNKARYLINRTQRELGLTRAQAVGLAGNIYQESKFNEKAVGDGGKAHGIAQWHPARREGVDILNMSFEDQVTYLIDELKGPEKNALSKLTAAKTAGDAAYVVDKFYERSNGKSVKTRQKMAGMFLNMFYGHSV